MAKKHNGIEIIIPPFHVQSCYNYKNVFFQSRASHPISVQFAT